MRVHVTQPLFAWDCLDDSPSPKTIREFLAVIPDAKLLEGLRQQRGKGRDDPAAGDDGPGPGEGHRRRLHWSVGPPPKSGGIPLEEITGAIQMLSNAGIQGEMAGSTLRGILLSLTSPTASAAHELKRHGVRVTDEAGNDGHPRSAGTPINDGVHGHGGPMC